MAKQSHMVQEIFNRRQRFIKAVRARHFQNKNSDKEYRFLNKIAEDTLLDRLLDMTMDFKTAIQMGGTQKLSSPKIKTLFHTAFDLQADEEYLPFTNASLDCVLAPLTLHTINDLPGTLIQVRRALKPDGLFLGALFGGETLFELRDCLARAEQEITRGLSPRIFPFADKQQMGGLMQRAGFALPVVDSDIIRVSYQNMFDLMHDLRGMNETNIISARQKYLTRRTIFRRAQEIYKNLYALDNGRLEASFEIIYLTGWGPAATQQQPLRPGSAKTSLADHLDTQEIGAGEMVQ